MRVLNDIGMRSLFALLCVGLLPGSDVLANDWIGGPNKGSWYAYRDMTPSAFSKTFKTLQAKGLRPVDIDYSDGRYSVSWAKDNVSKWQLRRDMTETQYTQYWNQYKKQGYRPADIEVYKIGKQTRFAGIWVKDKIKGWRSKWHLTSKQFSAEVSKHKNKYVPVDFEAYTINNKLRYAIIWVESKYAKGDWEMKRGLSAKQVGGLNAVNRVQGRIAVDIEAYRVGKSTKYGVIWFKQSGKKDKYHVGYGLKDLQFFNKFHELTDRGYRLIDIEQYKIGKSWHYAGVWKKHGKRLSRSKLNEVDSLFQQYFRGNQLPGLSVAIIQNGKMVFRKGYGYADRKKRHEANGDTVYLAASVSKAIGATLALKIMDESSPRLFRLNTPLRKHFKQLPKHHTYRLRDLLTHRSCIRDKKPNESKTFNKQFEHQITVAKQIWVDPLDCEKPPASEHMYSTPSFTILGALLETHTKKKVRDLIRIHFTEGLDLPSMRAQYPLTPKRLRSQIYRLKDRSDPIELKDNTNEVAPRWNNSWKVLGGAIEVSAVDLARFGYAVANGQVVSKKRLDVMWTRQAGSYGLGWVVAADGKFASHSGSYIGSHTYLRVYKDKSLVVAIMSNRRNNVNQSVFSVTNELVKLLK